MNKAIRTQCLWRLLAGLTFVLLDGGIVRSALAEPATAPTGAMAATPKATGAPAAAKAIDPVKACDRFITAELSGKPLDSSELPADLQQSFRLWLDQVTVCKGFLAKSDQPCAALPTADRQKDCKSKVAELQLPPLKFARKMFSDGFFRMCMSGNPETECHALESAVLEGDPKRCSAMTSPAMQRMCTAWALGDPAKCDAKDGQMCTDPATMIAKVAKEGAAAFPPAPDPESRFLQDIVAGRSKAGCDGLVNIVKTDCAEKVKAAAATSATPASGTPMAGNPPPGNPPPGNPPPGNPPPGNPAAGAPAAPAGAAAPPK